MINIKSKIEAVERIDVGFDIALAEKKFIMLELLLSEIENTRFADVCKLSREELIYVIQLCYGISYEIGNTKQNISNPARESDMSKRVLLIARMIYGKSKDLIPYLSLCLVDAMKDEAYCEELRVEIREIENL